MITATTLDNIAEQTDSFFELHSAWGFYPEWAEDESRAEYEAEMAYYREQYDVDDYYARQAEDRWERQFWGAA